MCRHLFVIPFSGRRLACGMAARDCIVVVYVINNNGDDDDDDSDNVNNDIDDIVSANIDVAVDCAACACRRSARVDLARLRSRLLGRALCQNNNNNTLLRCFV